MGLIGAILGAGPARIGAAAGELAEVFVGNRADREAAEAARGQAALVQFAAEFSQPPAGRFDRFMNAFNRLPRPLMVCGTLGLFAHAMIAPDSFARRMASLALVPDPLWWLLGAIVSFYFGARELHYARDRMAPVAAPRAEAGAAARGSGKTTATAPRPGDPRTPGASLARAGATSPAIAGKAADPNFNAAVEEWRARRR